MDGKDGKNVNKGGLKKGFLPRRLTTKKAVVVAVGVAIIAVSGSLYFLNVNKDDPYATVITDAKELHDKHQYELAKKTLTDYLATKPRDKIKKSNAYTELIAISREQHDDAKVEVFAKQAEADGVTPGYDVYMALAEVAVAKKQNQQAIDYYTNALNIVENDKSATAPPTKNYIEACIAALKKGS